MEKIVFIIPDIIELIYALRARAFGRYNSHPPLGVLSLMTVLYEVGYEIILYDNFMLRMNNEDLLEKILIENPKSNIFCFSINCTNILPARDLATRLKKHNKNFKLICGGPHVSSCLEDCKPFFDYYVQGEAEDVIIELIENALVNGQRHKVLESKRINDLNKLPIPNRSLIDMNLYTRKVSTLLGRKTDNVVSSRGCIFDCTFCNSPGLWDRKFKARSAEKMLEEVKYLANDHGSEAIYFFEDNFIIDKKRVREFAKLVQNSNLDLKFKTFARIDLIDDEILKVMQDAGFAELFFGIESGCDKTLKYINKHYTKEIIYKKIEMLHKYNFKFSTGFLFGFPYETEEDIFETIHLIEDIDAEWAFFQKVVGYPTSKMYFDCLENNFIQERVGSVFTIKPKYVSFDFLVQLENEYESKFNKIRYSEEAIYDKFNSEGKLI